MLILLLGSDEFSKQEYLGQMALARKAEVEVFGSGDELPNLEHFVGQNLFAVPKIFVLKNLISKLAILESSLDRLIQANNLIAIVEEKLDKRLAFSKQLLGHKRVETKNFVLPHGRELDDWIAARTKRHGAQFSPDAVKALASALGRDNAKETKVGGKLVACEEVYNLWQADNEIKKLTDWARGREVMAEDVANLVASNEEIDALKITNAIADNQKQRAMTFLDSFLANQPGADEKAAVIQLNALLSEQFRNVLLVQDFVAAKSSEAEILTATGWKPPRLFVIKKIASKFPVNKVENLLNKLSALDAELKTSAMPPRVLLDLIMAQLF